MEHKLRVLIRFNIDLNCASIEIRGCLTQPGCAALLPVIRRARRLSGGMRVVVNLRKARHIDEDGLEHLRVLCAEEPHLPEDAAQIETPGTFPECPVVQVLHNNDAAAMAFLQSNPSVFSDRTHTDEPRRLDPSGTGGQSAAPLERSGNDPLVPGTGNRPAAARMVP